MLNIFLLEPASSGKRRTFSDRFIKTKRAERPVLMDVKKRLREIRDYSLCYQDELIKDLMTSLEATPSVNVSFAIDAHHAVKRLKEISGNSPVVINRSNVVTRELVPLLTTDNYSVIDSYYSEFKPFDNRFKENWQLPDMLF